MDLKKLVITKIGELGVKQASRYFGVSTGTISNWSRGSSEPSVTAVQMVLNESPKEASELKEIASDVISDLDSIPEYERNNPTIAWEGREVMLLLPVYRTFNADTFYTILANYAKYGPSKIGIEMIKRTVIHEARNMLIDKAMKVSDAKTFIMADDDMVLPCGSASLMNGRYAAGIPDKKAALIAFDRLMASGVERGIVGGLYFGRHSSGQAQCSIGMGSNAESNKLRRGEYKGHIKVEWVGTGLVKVERWVIDKMKQHIDDGNWPECKPSFSGSWYGYFSPLRVRVGEDVSFGRRAKEIGIQSYLDTDLICLHVGDQMFGPANTKG